MPTPKTPKTPVNQAAVQARRAARSAKPAATPAKKAAPAKAKATAAPKAATPAKTSNRRIANQKEKAKAAAPTPEQLLALKTKALDALAAPGVVTDRSARSLKAKTEAATLKRWETEGSKGERPATPNLDVIDALYEAKEAGVSVATGPSKARISRVKRAEPQYMVNGNPLATSYNKLSNVAYFRTAGIVDDQPRLGVKDFIALLATLGVEDPYAVGWSVALPNGTTVGTVEMGTVTPPTAATRGKGETQAA